jgi:CHAT domain-containing protein
MVRLLQGQFAQFRLGADHLHEFAKPKREAALLPLQELYDELLAPLRAQLDARHLIIAPHGFLHYLPFPALYDGERFLVEEFAVSYSTSASLYYLCCTKKQPVEDRALVLAVPDGHSQHAAMEAEAIAAVVPNAKVLIGEAASDAALREQGPGSRYVHLSTGAMFRGDNPLFSSLRLGNSQLSLFDLYHLRLPCELVSLSGCGPGLNPAGNGEELAGMLRGLLYAGAEAVLTSIWNLPGASTSKFLGSFYRHLNGPYDKVAAMQKAMLELRDAYPHPYFWAPYALYGKSGDR